MSVGSLLGNPAASGLFHRAILQSGAASTFNGVDTAAEVVGRMATRLGGREALRAAPWERLLQAQGEVFGDLVRHGVQLPFAPVVDGTVLPRSPIETIAAGAAAQVGLMTGTNRDEAALFLAAGRAAT